MDSLWKIPSLEDFLTGLVQEIWKGKIVLAFLPKCIPDGFLKEFKGRCKKSNIDSFQVVDFGNNGNSFPEDVLYDHFELGQREAFIEHKLSAIFDAIDKPVCQLLVFKNISRLKKDGFVAFMDELFHYSRASEEKKRHKILAIIEYGAFSPEEFSPEPTVVKAVFSGRINALAQLNGLRYVFGFNNSYGELSEKIIVSLAQFDYKLTERLIDCKSILDDYTDILNEYARERGWGDVGFIDVRNLTIQDKWDRWSMGILDFANETDIIYHSAYLQIHGKRHETQKRIWEACVGVLLPLIERMRNKIISSEIIEFADKAYLMNGNKLINSKHEFEIGELAYGINNRLIFVKGADQLKRKCIIDFANLCRNIRNDLAHLEIPESDDLHHFFEESARVDKILRI